MMLLAVEDIQSSLYVNQQKWIKKLTFFQEQLLLLYKPSKWFYGLNNLPNLLKCTTLVMKTKFKIYLHSLYPDTRIPLNFTQLDDTLGQIERFFTPVIDKPLLNSAQAEQETP